MQSMRLRTPSSTFRDLRTTSSAHYGSRSYINPITGELSPVGPVYTRSTSVSKQPRELIAAPDRTLAQSSSTSSLMKSGQSARSMSVDRRTSLASPSLSAAHSKQQTPEPHSKPQMPQLRSISSSHDKSSRPLRLMVADSSSSSSSSSGSSDVSEASSPARVTPGRRSLAGTGSSAGLAAGIRSLSVQLSSPSSSGQASSSAALQSSSTPSVLSRCAAPTQDSAAGNQS